MQHLVIFIFALFFSLAMTPLTAANWNNNQNTNLDTSISMSLTCETTDYGQSNYPLDWSKSWIPEKYSASIQGGEINTSLGGKGRILRVTNNRIEFIFDEYADTRNDGGYIKGTYFRSNGKITARIEFR